MSPATIPSSPFDAAQLAHWRTRLLAERRVAAGDAVAANADASALDCSQPHDEADQAQLREDSLSCSETAAEVVLQIDEALRRIDQAQPVPFGICERCLVPIEWERLELMPWTPLCSRGAHAQAG